MSPSPLPDPHLVLSITQGPLRVLDRFPSWKYHKADDGHSTQLPALWFHRGWAEQGSSSPSCPSSFQAPEAKPHKASQHQTFGHLPRGRTFFPGSEIVSWFLSGLLGAPQTAVLEDEGLSSDSPWPLLNNCKHYQFPEGDRVAFLKSRSQCFFLLELSWLSHGGHMWAQAQLLLSVTWADTGRQLFGGALLRPLSVTRSSWCSPLSNPGDTF